YLIVVWWACLFPLFASKRCACESQLCIISFVTTVTLFWPQSPFRVGQRRDSVGATVARKGEFDGKSATLSKRGVSSPLTSTPFGGTGTDAHAPAGHCRPLVAPPDL